jgi:multiple sugar transport system substrate-binding protein
MGKLTGMQASDAAPDCLRVQQIDLAGLATTGGLLDLSPLVARDARQVNPADFFPAHLDGGRWRDRQVAITPDGCAVLEYYNLTLFREAGAPLPTARWTWDDYLTAARALTRKDGAGQVVQAGIGTVPSGNGVWPWLWSNGGDALSPDFSRVLITEQPVADAVQFAVDLVQKHGVTASSPGVDLGPDPSTAGKVAMWRGNRGAFGGLRSVTSFKFDVVPIARAPGKSVSTTITTPGHIAIARTNTHPDAAWEWLKFLTSTEALVIRSTIAGGCPSRKSATEDASYKDYTMPALVSPAANKTFADVLADPKAARFVPKYVAFNEAQDIVSRSVGAALRGEQSVPAALEAARRELQALLRDKPQPPG